MSGGRSTSRHSGQFTSAPPPPFPLSARPIPRYAPRTGGINALTRSEADAGFVSKTLEFTHRNTLPTPAATAPAPALGSLFLSLFRTTLHTVSVNRSSTWALGVDETTPRGHDLRSPEHERRKRDDANDMFFIASTIRPGETLLVLPPSCSFWTGSRRSITLTSVLATQAFHRREVQIRATTHR